MSGLSFFEWESLELVRRIDIQPKHVFWSESGELACLATEDSYFILRYDANIVAKALETKEGISEDGCEDAFTVSKISVVICGENFFEIQSFMKLFLFFSLKGSWRGARECAHGTLGRRLFHLHKQCKQS